MKEQIVEQAIPLFLQYGFKSATVDDIAERMSVSKKTIYTYFPKKEALVETAVMHHFDTVMEKILTIAKYSKDPIIELYQIKKEALNHLSNDKNSPVYQLQKYYNGIYKKLKLREFTLLQDLFYKSLQKGIETGLFRSDLDLNFVIRIFLNGIRGIQDIELFPDNEFKIDQVLIHFSEYHLRAISTPEGIEILNNYKKEMNL